MKKMKKLFFRSIAAILLFATLLGSFAGCANNNNDNEKNGESSYSDSVSDSGSTSDSKSDLEDDTSTDVESPIPDDGTCQVAFRNPNGSYIDTKTIKRGDKVEKPQDPTSINGIFVGWYSDKNGTTPFDFDTPVEGNISIYAIWDEELDCNVTSLTVDTSAKSVTVNAITNESCTVNVYFVVEEDYFNAEKVDYSYIEGCSVSLRLSSLVPTATETYDFDLPEYFVAVATVTESEEIGERVLFVTTEYTEKNKEFQAVTPESFTENDTVVSLGKNNDGSFGVLADDVRVLTADSIKEYEGEDGDISAYEIVSPSEDISVGDKIFITDKNGEGGALFLVEEILESGDVYTVVPMTVNQDNADKVSDFYKFIKVDTYYTFNVDTEEDSEKIALLKSKDENEGIKLKFEKVLYKGKGLEVTGKLKGTVTPRVKVEYSPAIFGESYFFCSVVFDSTIYTQLRVDYESEKEGSMDVTILDHELGKSLGKWRLPLGIYGFNLSVGYGFDASIAVSGSLAVGNTTKSSIGFSFSTRDGVNPIKEFDSTSEIEECNGKATVRFGLVPSIGIGYLGNLFEVKLESFLGAEVRAVACGQWIKPPAIENEDTHLCELCVDGEIYGIATTSAKFETLLNFHVEFEIKNEDDPDDKGYVLEFELNQEFPLVDSSWLITDFYVSIISDEDFEKIGKGDCPNHAKTEIRVYDNSGTGTKHPVEMKIFDANGAVVKILVNPNFLGGASLEEAIKDHIAKYPYYTFSDLGYLKRTVDEKGNTVYLAEVSLPSGQYTAAVFYEREIVGFISEDGKVKESDYVEKNEDFGSVDFAVSSEFDTYVGGVKSESVDVYPQNYPFRKKTYVIKDVYQHVLSCYTGIDKPGTFVMRPKVGKTYVINYRYEGWSFLSGTFKAVTDDEGKLNLTFYFLDIPGDVLLEFDPEPFDFEYTYVLYIYESQYTDEGECIDVLKEIKQDVWPHSDRAWGLSLSENYGTAAHEKIYEWQLDAGKGEEYLWWGTPKYGEGFVEVTE